MRVTLIRQMAATASAAVALLMIPGLSGAAAAATGPASGGPATAARSLSSGPGAGHAPAGLSAGNEPEGFPPCDAAHDGDVYVDGEDGQIWYCKYVPGAGFIWVPRLAPEDFSVARLYGGYPSLAQSADGVPDSDGGFTTVANLQVTDGNGNPLDQPPGWIAQLVKLQYWNGSNWIICADPGQYTFNQSWISSLGVGWRFGVPPCGAGWYAAEADAWVWDGSAWRGGGQIANPSGVCVDCGWAGARAPAIRNHPSRLARVKALIKPPLARPHR